MDNPTEFYAVHVELVAVLDGMFEIWLGISFATMAAFFLGSKLMNRYIAGIAIAMYLFASYIFSVRYLHTLSVFGFLNDKLIEAGFDPYPAPELPVPVFYVMLIGTVITLSVSGYTFVKQEREGT